MYLKDLRQAVLKRAIVIGLILLVSGVVIYVLHMNLSKSVEKYQWLKTSVNSLNAKLEGLNRKTLEFSDAVKAWEKMDEADKQLQGLQISKANELLKEYEKLYKLSEMSTTFSKPQELSEGIVSETVKVIDSQVVINFKALSDEYALNFIHALENQLPGYVQITSFSLTKDAQITKDILERVARGETPPLVVGNVEFIWRELKYIPTKERAEPAVPEDGV